ncbi:MAG TPA: TonB-dependent receptor [Candidatus Rubrimentiphilum sp.]|nr:TonB-dependent receptor [Candidatus Rubrimentiphilum sp.]
MRLITTVALLSGLALALPIPSRAAANGSISGSVRDIDGRPLAAARVVLSGPQRAATQSDSAGAFRFGGLAPGTYMVNANKGGFRAAGVDGIAVNENAQRVDLVLEAATFSTLKQIAEVRSVAGRFNDSPSAISVLTQQRFADTGLLQIAHVLDQTPGVVSARPASADAAVPGSITSPNLRGALDYEKATLLDGRPLINGRNGDYPTMLVNSLLFDSIEVVEGPTAYAPQINYGIGGTLNFRTGNPTLHRTGQVIYGLDNMSGSFGQLRLSDTVANGRLGYLFTIASYGSQGPLNNYPSLFSLPAGTRINGAAVSGSTTSGNPINGQQGPYPIAGALGNPPNAYVTLVGCCQAVNSSFLNHGELAKLQYRFSSATQLTVAYVGIQSQYDGPAAGFTQIGSIFAPTSAYSGTTYAPGQTVLLNNRTTLPDQRLYDNEPMFEAELRTTLHQDTVLARFYSAILARQTTSDLSAPSANYVTGPIALYGTATVGGAVTAFNGTPANLTIPTPYSNTVEHDALRGISFEYDHPAGPNVYTFAFDRNSSLTNAYSVTGSATNPQGNLSTTIAAGTRQDFTTYLLRAQFALNDKTQLTLANYFNTYRNTYTPQLSGGDFVFVTSTTTHDDPRLGLTYRANPDLSVRLSMGSAIAPPYPALIDNLTQTPAQVYTTGAQTVTIGNNSGGLRPETSFGYDLGADWRTPSGDILSVDAYLTNLRNQFVAVVYPSGTTYNPPGTTAQVPVYVSTNQNLAQSRFEGIDATWRRDPARGIGYTFSIALQRAYAYNLPASFYSSAAGPYTTNLGVVNGTNFYAFNAPFFNGISNKSEAYSQGYAGIHARGGNGQYGEFGFTFYGSNNTYNIPAFMIASASYRQPIFGPALALQVSADNIFNTDSGSYVSYGAGIGAPLANGQFGVRSAVPYGPASLRVMLVRSL